MFIDVVFVVMFMSALTPPTPEEGGGVHEAYLHIECGVVSVAQLVAKGEME